MLEGNAPAPPRDLGAYNCTLQSSLSTSLFTLTRLHACTHIGKANGAGVS
jgi:hypothetical protein